MIDRNAQKLIRMVDELLDFSKVDKGNYKIEWTDGNLTNFLENLIEDFKQEAQDKQISLRFESEVPKHQYRFSADILEKIVFNLVSNALKYAPQKSEIFIKTSIKDSNMVLVVKNEGEGIEIKDQERIFERFYRSPKHKELPGTGLGLAVVKEFVDLIGGSIQLKSEKNEGALFQITLPVAKSENIEQHEDEDDSSQKLQLLVCDDDQDILAFLGNILKKDYSVQTSINGLEALKYLKDNAPDVILSDVVMPELDGLALLEKIKSDPLLRSIPVVLFSAKSALDSRLTGLQAGADYYLPKPFNPEELKWILRNITSKIEKNRAEFEEQRVQKIPFTERLQSENDYVNKALQFVINNIDNPAYSVNELAADMCISRSQLHRKLTLYTGNSATQFIRMIRLEKAKDLLESNFGNVEEVAYACGFSSRSYFSSSFVEYFGKKPSELLGS
jgi:CheY-like chemotaxis protein